MRKQPIFGLLLLAVAIFGWFTLVRDQISNFGEKALEARALSVEAVSYEERLKHITTIRNEGDQTIRRTLDSFFVAIPRESQIPEVLVMIEQFGNTTGISFSSVGVGSPSENEVPVSLVFSGQMPIVKSFLDTLHENIRTVRIKSQSLSSDGTGMMNVTMQIGLIYQGQ